MHRPALADDVRDTMRAVGHSVVESNPFTQSLPAFGSGLVPSPYVARLSLMWHTMRTAVEARVPSMVTGPLDVERVMEAVDEAYQADAYHSLSIEGYQVTFVFIHPYMDGNGRIARFLLNVMLVSGGFPWTIIPVARRDEYMAALDAASARNDIAPFAQFVQSCIGVPQAPQA